MSTLENLYQKKYTHKKSKKHHHNKGPPDDILTMLCSGVSIFNYKIGFCIFILFILLNSTVFYFQVLNKMSCNTYDIKQDKVTEKGIVVIGSILVVCYLILDALARYDYI